jgi:hypothetical protein
MRETLVRDQGAVWGGEDEYLFTGRVHDRSAGVPAIAIEHYMAVLVRPVREHVRAPHLARDVVAPFDQRSEIRLCGRVDRQKLADSLARPSLAE